MNYKRVSLLFLYFFLRGNKSAGSTILPETSTPVIDSDVHSTNIPPSTVDDTSVLDFTTSFESVYTKLPPLKTSTSDSTTKEYSQDVTDETLNDTISTTLSLETTTLKYSTILPSTPAQTGRSKNQTTQSTPNRHITETTQRSQNTNATPDEADLASEIIIAIIGGGLAVVIALVVLAVAVMVRIKRQRSRGMLRAKSKMFSLEPTFDLKNKRVSSYTPRASDEMGINND